MAASTMTFCAACDSLMSPMEDRETKRLMFKCTNCGHGEEAGDRTCVYRHSLVAAAQDVLAKVKPGIVDDATLQRNAALCDKCKQHGAVFFQIPSSATDERLKLINVCTTCGHKWES